MRRFNKIYKWTKKTEKRKIADRQTDKQTMTHRDLVQKKLFEVGTIALNVVEMPGQKSYCCANGLHTGHTDGAAKSINIKAI